MHVFMRTIVVVGILGMQLVAQPLAMACPPANSGRVSGTNTVDIVNFADPFDAGDYVLGVKASGSGNNTLTIRVQVPGTLGWNTIASRTIDMGTTNGCGYAEIQFSLSSSSDVRYRFSRTVASTAIDYDWDHDYIVLWGGAQFRCLTC